MSHNVIDITARLQRDSAFAPGAGRVITRHKASGIMFDGVTMEVDMAGRVLSANIEAGEVYMHIEEHVNPAAKARLHFKGYRVFGDLVPPGAQYVASVYEYGDHAHIYLVAGVAIPG